MSRELIAIMGLSLTLIAAVFAGGVRIGTLTERVEAQTRQIELLATDLRDINHHFIVWAGAHREPDQTPVRGIR